MACLTGRRGDKAALRNAGVSGPAARILGRGPCPARLEPAGCAIHRLVGDNDQGLLIEPADQFEGQLTATKIVDKKTKKRQHSLNEIDFHSVKFVCFERVLRQMAKKLNKNDIYGVIPPLVSTFGPNGDLDLRLFEKELEFMEQVGIDLAVIGGSTGSGDELSIDELGALIETATRKSKIHIIAGVITTTTPDAIKRGQVARDAGAEALMVGPPIYTTPSDDGLDGFLTDVNEATGLGIIYYNHFFNPASVMQRVAHLPGVICLKEVALEPVAQLVQTVGDRVAIAAGADAVNIASFMLGAVASISGINTVIPAQYREIFAAHEANDYRKGRQLTEKIAPLAREMIKGVNFPARVKFAINLLGREVGPPRKPSGNLAKVDQENIIAALKHAELLK